MFQANHLLHKLIEGKTRKSLEWIRIDDAAVFDAELISSITSSSEDVHSEKWISAVRTHIKKAPNIIISYENSHLRARSIS